MKNKIAECRKNRKMSQTQLSIKVGISRPYLSDIERGIKTPGAIIVKNICDVLDVSFEKLFCADDVHYSIQEEMLDPTGTERR